MIKRVFLLLTLTQLLYANDAQAQNNLNIVWIIVSTALVFLMQAGFTALEAGLVRAKNSINVAVKNFSDLAFAMIAYFICGFALMFGTTWSGFLGTDNFFLTLTTEPYDYSFFIFQAVFAGTAATIVSGAVAERMQFGGYLFISSVLSALVYPISGHWIWGDGGWLSEMGFVDFAGSTVVHSLGAWVGLIGAWLLGPRLDRFDENGKVIPIPGANVQMATVGVFILWFGWFGFNGGSTLIGDGSIAKVVVNTSLSAAIAGIISFIVSKAVYGVLEVTKMINGALAGLVAITAGCSVVEPLGALYIGIGAGLVVHLAEWILIKLRIDDPIGAIPVHGVAGVWGTFALAIFANEENLPTGNMFEQMYIQSIGIGAVFIWAIFCGLIMFATLKGFRLLRVPPHYEIRGLNESEHGSKLSLLDTYDAIDYMVKSGDFSKRVEIEIGTEAGDLAKVFNNLAHDLETVSNIAYNVSQGDLSKNIEIKNEKDKLGNAISLMTNNLRDFSDNLKSISETIYLSVDTLTHNNSELLNANSNLLNGAINVSSHVKDTNKSITFVEELSKDGMKSLTEVVQNMENINTMMVNFQNNIKELDVSVNEISGLLNSIEEIADQTNLLALNASIEASRAGEFGKGFAVVADSVRDLAEKTQNSIEQINGKLKNLKIDSTNAVKSANSGKVMILDGVERLNETQSTFNKIQHDINVINLKVDDIEGVVTEQLNTTEQSKESVNKIDNVIFTLTDNIKMLKDIVSYFKTGEKNDFCPNPL